VGVLALFLVFTEVLLRLPLYRMLALDSAVLIHSFPTMGFWEKLFLPLPLQDEETELPLAPLSPSQVGDHQPVFASVRFLSS
jgi:hypothetical protein